MAFAIYLEVARWLHSHAVMLCYGLDGELHVKVSNAANRQRA